MPGNSSLPIILLSLLVSSSCGEHRAQQACRMEDEAVIVRTDGTPGAVAVSRREAGGFVIAWSAGGETAFASANERGERVGSVTRIERLQVPRLGDGEVAAVGTKTFWPPQEGASFDAEDLAIASLDGGATYLAILERPHDGRAGGAHVTVLSGGESQKVSRVGSAGEYASRISLAADGDRIAVAWHEGDLGGSKIFVAALDPETLEVISTREVEDGAVAGVDIAFGEEGGMIAWSRTAHDGVEPRSLVRAAVLDGDLDRGRPRTIAACRHLDPQPSLVAMAGGEFGLAYRDDDDEDMRPEYYFVRLDARGEPVGKSARISRADGFTGPELAAVDSLVYGAVIRSFQHNLLVGLNRFDEFGRKLGGEFQIYADKSDFVRVAMATNDDEILLVYGEDRRGSGRILSGHVACSGERR